MTQWKEVDGNLNYLVSNEGAIYSKISSRLLKPSKDARGYLVVNIKLGDESTKPRYIHRLVAHAFVEGCGVMVNHKDGDKTNNQVCNLEWCSNEENLNHAWESGLMKRGEQLSFSKLSEETVRRVCELLQSGAKTSEIVSKIPAMTRNRLLDIRARRSWKHVSKDYDWQSFPEKRNNKSKNGIKTDF